MFKISERVIRILVHAATLLPLAILAWDFLQGQLTANPIQEIQLRTGKYALVLLVLSLACTPMSSALRLKWIIRLRRPLGLYAFMYAALHLLNMVGLDYGFDLSLLLEDVLDKRFVLAGLASFLALLPLGISSTKGWMKRLGKNWKRLHRLVYLASILSVLHFVWLVKADITEPLIYSAVVASLLIARIPHVKKAVNKLGRQLKIGRETFMC